eukprot:9343798-Pyramimonas_sp.AAC.1
MTSGENMLVASGGDEYVQLPHFGTWPSGVYWRSTSSILGAECSWAWCRIARLDFYPGRAIAH